MVVGCTDGHSDPALIQAERSLSLDAKAKEVEKLVQKGLRMTNDAHADGHADAQADVDAEAHAHAAADAHTAADAHAAADAGAPSRNTKVVPDAAAASASAS
eukprot:COSAG06_NODE_23749_length_682_cov_6.600343_3_plen_101_part_01